MERLAYSNVSRFVASGEFFWSAGIEDTFITHPWPATGRTLDEYELTGHYERWREDFELLKQLGVKLVRYGIPWHRVNPARNRWDWSFADAALERLLECGIEPIVDLVHYGLPPWIEGAYLNPEFPDFMAEYASRVAGRYKGRIYCYTPLNEPRVTAWYCGKLGWWPPARRGWRGFIEVMAGVCAGIVKTVRTLNELRSDLLTVHVDATDLYQSPDPALQEEVKRRQEIVFLALDLISGRITPDHALYSWLLKNGLSGEKLEFFKQLAVKLDFIGINLYPLFSQKILSRSAGRLRIRMPYASAEIIPRLARLYWDRYHTPLLISETASEGSVARREAWLRDSVAAVGEVRASGIPLVGYTWWPMFSLVTWGYRQGRNPPEHYLKKMGLWDLRDTARGRLQRIPTRLVEQYREIVSAGAGAFGQARVAA